MFYKIIAWRVLHVTMLGRACPELSCEAVFAEEEWQPVWTIVEKTPLPKQPPSLGAFIPILAQPGRLQPSRERQTTRRPSHLDRDPPHDRLHPPLDHPKTNAHDLCVINRAEAHPIGLSRLHLWVGSLRRKNH
jgi:hypothetical protein